MSKFIGNDHDFNNSSRILNLPNPVGAQEPATKAYADALAEGNPWKDGARVSTQSNINLASPGATIDGITMAVTDRVLVRNQTSQPTNGIYIWNGAGVPMTRSPDASTADELEMARIPVEEGTDAGVNFRQTTVNFVLGTGNVSFQADSSAAPSASETTAGIAEFATQSETDAGTDDTRTVTPLKLQNWSGRRRKYSALFGDGSATSFAINHNLNTRDFTYSIRYTGGTFDFIDADVRATTANSATVIFAAGNVPTSNQFTITIIG